MKYLCLGFALLINLAVAPIAMVASAEPQIGDPLLVIAMPWLDGGADRVILNAGGALVGPEQAPVASMTTYDDVMMLDRLDDSGAWLVLSAKNMATFCNFFGVT